MRSLGGDLSIGKLEQSPKDSDTQEVCHLRRIRLRLPVCKLAGRIAIAPPQEGKRNTNPLCVARD
eukprot:6633190-Prorocentrum_lima.AAC.1